MARFLKHEIVNKILDVGIVPVFYNKDLEISKKIVEAWANGGAKVIEFTNRGDFISSVHRTRQMVQRGFALTNWGSCAKLR